MSPVDEYTMWLERFRTGKNVDKLEDAYEELLSQVKRIDPITIAETTASKYLGDGVPRVLIPFLRSWFSLDLLPYRLRAEHPEFDTLPLKVLVLQHIVAAAENEGSAVKVIGEWIDCRSLQNGAIMGAHLSGAINEVLTKFFSFDRDEQTVRALGWGGKPLELGDEGFSFNFFPRLPVAVINWKGDDEFPAYAKILYDVSACNYMPTHGLTALTEFLAHRLAE